MLHLPLLLTLLVQVYSIEIDYYDLPDFLEPFVVDCGSAANKKMDIVYAGDAYAVYVPGMVGDPNCLFQELGPAVWSLTNALANCASEVTSQTGPTLNMIDVVVQVGPVRVTTDTTHIVTCNYELGGEQDSASANTVEGTAQKIPSWHFLPNRTSESSVALMVYDTTDTEVTTTALGNYIQLRALLNTTGTTEVSLKMWNCRAKTTDSSYYILQNGCGDGTVIYGNRGFHTRVETDYAANGYERVSRSSYFKTFLFPGSSAITFQCDYLVCDNTTCDGYSCPSRNARRKRDLSAGQLPSEEMLATVTSEPIEIIIEEKSLNAGELIHSVHDLRAGSSMDAELEEGPGLLTIGLIAGLAVLCVMLLLSICVAVSLWRRVVTPAASDVSSYAHAKPLLPDDSLYRYVSSPQKRVL